MFSSPCSEGGEGAVAVRNSKC
eukprot:SAG11_NODE_10958_length_793_cov_0.959654_1_plen_21_part_10